MYSVQWGGKIQELKGCLNTLWIFFCVLVVVAVVYWSVMAGSLQPCGL